MSKATMGVEDPPSNVIINCKTGGLSYSKILLRTILSSTAQSLSGGFPKSSCYGVGAKDTKSNSVPGFSACIPPGISSLVGIHNKSDCDFYQMLLCYP